MLHLSETGFVKVVQLQLKLLLGYRLHCKAHSWPDAPVHMQGVDAAHELDLTQLHRRQVSVHIYSQALTAQGSVVHQSGAC